MWSRQLIDAYDLPLPRQLGPNLDLVMRMARVSGRAPAQICADRSFGGQQPYGGLGRVQGDVVVVAELPAGREAGSGRVARQAATHQQSPRRQAGFPPAALLPGGRPG